MDKQGAMQPSPHSEADDRVMGKGYSGLKSSGNNHKEKTRSFSYFKKETVLGHPGQVGAVPLSTRQQAWPWGVQGQLWKDPKCPFRMDAGPTDQQ